MNKLLRSVALLAFTLIGLGGCAHEGSSLSDPHPVTVADLQAVLRDEWSRHLFWTRNVVLDNAKQDLRSKGFAENAVATNMKEIARTLRPFYGAAASDQLHTLLTKHYEAVKAYSDSTVAGSMRQRDESRALLTSNTDEIAAFLSTINPHLSKDTVRSLFTTLENHHVTQIKKFQDKDYQGEEETWPAMEHHVYVIADTLTNAIAKQFSAKFSN